MNSLEIPDILDTPDLWVNSLEISRITLKFLVIPWINFKALLNPFESHQISLNSRWTLSKPFKSLNISWNFWYTSDTCTWVYLLVKSYEIDWNPLNFLEKHWNTVKPLELPWIIWKSLKYRDTYELNPCCTWMPRFEIPWNSIETQ